MRKQNHHQYKFEKTEPSPIPTTIEDDGVIKVYYVKDETKTHELSYTVEYYKDGELVKEDTQTVSKNVWVNDTTLPVDVEDINMQ